MEGAMEGKGGQGEQLVSELCRVQGLVRQLELHLQAPDAAGSVEHCRRLAAQIVALTDRSIAFVTAAAMTPRSGTSSPLSDASDRQQPFRQANPKKRKATARWTSQVRVSAAGGAEGPGEDGHSWRKYGQKDILGAKHPRGYYRCTHRNSQGCAATKQVQRADHDPALFDVVYHGEHTCRASSAPAGGRIRPPPPPLDQQQQHNPHAHSLLQSLSAGLTVDTASLLHASSPMTPPSMASDSNGGLTPPMSAPYPANAFAEWPLDRDLQEVVSALTAVSGPAAPAMDDADIMAYYFEFDPTFGGGDVPSLF